MTLPLTPAERTLPSTADELRALLALHRLTIGDIQFQRLCRVVTHLGRTMIWAKERDISRHSTIIVVEPPNPPQAHALRRALAPDAIVIIPFSENPAFDYLKSKLRCHGVIGASASDSPHQIWWGGRSTAGPVNSLSAMRESHVVTCVRPNTLQDANAALFAKGLDIVNIAYTIERDEALASCDDKPDTRSRLLLNAWDRCNKPLIWLDPTSSTDFSNISLNISGADFAVIPTTTGMSTSILYFGRSQAAHDLLKSWHALCVEFSNLPANYLLDAAWALVSSQRALVTQWLPTHATTNIQNNNGQFSSAIENYMLTSPSQHQARKAGRTGSPEPYCVMKSRFEGRGPLTLITTSTASARDVADTVESAIAAFIERDGGFSSLGTTICQNEEEASDLVRITNEGWILYVLPGLLLDRDVFCKVSAHALTDTPVFIFPESYEQRQTSTGVSLHATRAKAIFGRATTFRTAAIKATARPPASLRVVPQKAKR